MESATHNNNHNETAMHKQTIINFSIIYEDYAVNK